MDREYVIKVDNVVKIYKMYNNNKEMLLETISPFKRKLHTEYKALDEVSFEVEKGETFGIIGTNGAGKSTLLKILTGVSNATSGCVEVKGKVAALLELGAGFNQEYTGIENIYLNGTMMGYTKSEMRNRVDKIVQFADIGDFINQPVKTYSSGMFARLAFAVAINVEPEILIVDEALSVGDVAFQNKCYKKFAELRHKGTTILFVSHDIHTIKQMCSRVIWIEKGRMQMCGDCIEVCNAYNNSINKKRIIEDYENIDCKYDISLLEEKMFPPVVFSNESTLNDDVEIVSCFIMDNKHDIVNECRVEKEYTISIVFKSNRDIHKCIVGFVLETVKGLWIINCNTAISGEKDSFYVRKNSLNRVDFKFTMPLLMKGDYVIGTAVSEGEADDFEIITWLYNVATISIVNPGCNSGVIDVPTVVDIFSKGI